MRAILLAAGQGTRLRPYTADRPKCMVEVDGRALLDWQIDTLQAAGVTDLVVVRGYQRSRIVQAGLRYVDNERWAKTHMVQSLRAAASELRGEVLICYTDLLYEPSIVSQLLRNRADIAVAVDPNWRALWQQRMDDPLADAETLRLNDNGLICEIGNKPNSYADIEAQYMGLIHLSPRGSELIRDALVRAAQREANGVAALNGKSLDRAHMTDLLQQLIDEGTPVRAEPIDGSWCEIDTPRDLEVATKLLHEGRLGDLPVVGVG